MSRRITMSRTYWQVRLKGNWTPDERRDHRTRLSNVFGIRRDKVWKTKSGCERAIQKAVERGLTPDLFEASEVAFLSF